MQIISILRMTKEQINKLILEDNFPGSCNKPELIETHISWVFLCDEFVYKIKKPIHYSFLDFSSIDKRKYYCQREIELNRRLTENIYVDVQPVSKLRNQIFIGNEEGEIIDYAVRMRRLDRDKQMNMLLMNNKVTGTNIQNLARKIANFHRSTDVIYQKDFLDVQEKFNDLLSEKDYLRENLSKGSANLIDCAVDVSNAFLTKNKELLSARLKAGFFRDCHGDLHSRNIFLLPSPQAFDCIEFNDDFRRIDVLNEVAFLCMDLDVFGRHDLSDLFMKCYNDLFPTIKNEEDQKLLIYYKSYRSNVRAKVNSLRARDEKSDTARKLIIAEVDRYLRLMESYTKEVE